MQAKFLKGMTGDTTAAAAATTNTQKIDQQKQQQVMTSYAMISWNVAVLRDSCQYMSANGTFGSIVNCQFIWSYLMMCVQPCAQEYLPVQVASCTTSHGPPRKIHWRMIFQMVTTRSLPMCLSLSHMRPFRYKEPKLECFSGTAQKISMILGAEIKWHPQIQYVHWSFLRVYDSLCLSREASYIHCGAI